MIASYFPAARAAVAHGRTGFQDSPVFRSLVTASISEKQALQTWMLSLSGLDFFG